MNIFFLKPSIQNCKFDNFKTKFNKNVKHLNSKRLTKTVQFGTYKPNKFEKLSRSFPMISLLVETKLAILDFQREHIQYNQNTFQNALRNKMNQ